MATREENLKKLNEELEKLSDEDLEEIAGGILKDWFDPPFPLSPFPKNPNQNQMPTVEASWV